MLGIVWIASGVRKGIRRHGRTRWESCGHPIIHDDASSYRDLQALIELAAGDHENVMALLQGLAAQAVVFGTEQINCPLRMVEFLQRSCLRVGILHSNQLAVMGQLVVELIEAAILK